MVSGPLGFGVGEDGAAGAREGHERSVGVTVGAGEGGTALNDVRDVGEVGLSGAYGGLAVHSAGGRLMGTLMGVIFEVRGKVSIALDVIIDLGLRAGIARGSGRILMVADR